MLPATTEFFHSRKERKNGLGLRSQCKVCQSAADRQRIRPKESPESCHQRYLATRETRLQGRYIYYHAHLERYTVYYRNYRQTHQVKMRVNGHNRRARSRAAPGKFTPEDELRQLKAQKGKCYYCRRKLGKGKGSYHADHIVPLSRGGSNTPDNHVITCPACNLSKKDKLPHEWPQGGRLL
jgi:5-methylcytosine-specific restriction endonuclease McrA